MGSTHPASSAELLQTILAAPREAGTPGLAEARSQVSGFLKSLGYQVTEQSVRFTPSVLRAIPVFGAGLCGLTLLQLPLLALDPFPPWAGLGLWLVGLAGLGALAVGLGSGWAPPGSEWREDANLIATRGPGPVRRWIVAHLDTKAQGHSMAGRLVGIWLAGLGIASVTALAVARVAGVRSPVSITMAAAVAIAGGLVLGRGTLREGTVGARDNASGLYAALVAAESIAGSSTGILITAAEEFGLVGARCFARAGEFPGVEAVNLDTLDDQGPLYLVTHGSADLEWLSDLEAGCRALELGTRRRRLPLGILVDSLPLAQAGARAVTLSRLDWGTLRRLHTRRDTPEGLAWDTARRVGRLIASWADRPEPARN
jgi:hypothetical protein